MQNLARFRTTLKFGGEYLRNGWRFSKSDFYSIYRSSSCVRQNKSGEVWSSDFGDLDVESYPPKVHFSEDHISAPRGCCAPKFLHALENHQVLLANPPPGTGAPLATFFKRGSKIALKFSILDEGSLEPKGVASWDFATWRAARWGDNAGTTFRGHHPLKIWECKKRAKFSTFNDNFRLWAQISLNCIGISTSCKRRYQIQLILRWIKKIV